MNCVKPLPEFIGFYFSKNTACRQMNESGSIFADFVYCWHSKITSEGNNAKTVDKWHCLKSFGKI